MIVCHRHRLIFIKTRKTAGSSIEIALSRLCEAGDIVTPLSAERGEESLRRQEGGYGPTGHLKPIRAHRGLKEWRRLLTRGQRAEWGEHATAAQVREIVGPEAWDRYLKVTVERNPWDRALSRYWWQKHRWEEKGRSGFPGLSEYLAWLEENKPHWITNWGHYAIGDEIAVDRVLFYESLSRELDRLSFDIQVSREKITLPRKKAKSGMRRENRPYREVFSSQDRDRIDRLCSREIEAFGYAF